MDTDLVIRAQHGDEEAFASLAVAAGDRLHAVAHRILRDIDLAEDATQQALLTVWRDLPQLRDPARFDAWSYRLLVRACYAEARRTRRWAPNLRLLPADEPSGADDSNTVADRDQLERGFRRLSIDHRAVVVLAPLPRHAARRGRRDPRRPRRDGQIPSTSCDARAARGARRRRPAHVAGGRADEHRSRRHPHRSVVAGGGRHRAPGPRPGRRARPSPRDLTAPSWWPARRLNEMNNALKLAIVAAAVVVIAVVGFNLVPRQGGIGGPGPSPTASPTPTPHRRRHRSADTMRPIAQCCARTIRGRSAARQVPATAGRIDPFIGSGSGGACATSSSQRLHRRLPLAGTSSSHQSDRRSMTSRMRCRQAGWCIAADAGTVGGHPARRSSCRSRSFDVTSAIRRRRRSPVGPTVADFVNAVANHPRLDHGHDARRRHADWVLTGSTSIYRSRRTSRARGRPGTSEPPIYRPGNPASTRRARRSAGTVGPRRRWHPRLVQSFDYAGTSAAHRAELQAIVNSIRIET